MADTISLLPPQPGQGVQQPQVTQGAGSQAGTISIKLPGGTILTGFIVNRDASGNPILRTPENGDVIFSTPFFLKIGSEVVLRVDNQAGAQVAHILSINGQPPEVAQGLSSFTEEPDVIVSGTLTPKPQVPQQQQPQTSYQPVRTVATPEPAVQVSTPAATTRGTLIASHQPSLPNGTQLSFKIVTIMPETLAAPTAQATPAAKASAAPALYAAYARTSSVGATPPPVEEPAASPAPQVQAKPAAPVAQPPGTPVASTPVGTTAPSQPASTQVVTAAPVITAPSPAPVISVATVIPSAPAQSPATVPATPTAQATQDKLIQQMSAPLPQPSLSPFVAAVRAAAATITEAVTHVTTPVEPEAARPLPLQPNQLVTAIAIGHEPTGETLLQTPAGIVRLQPGVNLPLGSNVQIQLVTLIPAESVETSAVLPALPAPVTELGREWTSLAHIVSLLESGPLQAGALSPNVPMLLSAHAAGAAIAPREISAGLMMFIVALQNGNFTSWLGETNVRWLQDNGYANLVKKADAEFTSIARQFADVQPQQWQTLFFPVAVDGQLQQVRLFVKRDRKKQEPGRPKPDEDTRFVLEVQLSQMGALQMDGFVHRGGKQITFDLHIRSLTPLSGEVQNDILNLYNSIGELTGYKGNLLFQSVKEFPVNPLEEVMAKAHSSVTA